LNPSRSRVEFWQQQFERAWEGSRWHSVQAALKGISQAEATWEPKAYRGFPWSVGSVRDIVFHLGGDDLIQVDAAFGRARLDWDEVTRQVECQGGHWQAALDVLTRGHKAVLDALGRLHDNDLDRRVSSHSQRGVRVEDVFQMLHEHKLYHAGQIVYVRCLVAGQKRLGKR